MGDARPKNDQNTDSPLAEQLTRSVQYTLVSNTPSADIEIKSTPIGQNSIYLEDVTV